MADDKKVDWAVWGNIPELYLWKAVALSLDLNPSSIQFNPNNWNANQKIEGVPQEFDDRLLVAEGNLFARKLPSRDRPYGTPVISRVALDVFAAWALQLTPPWQLPERLAALANVAALKAASADAPEKTLGTLERESLLKMVIGMAIGRYKYDPKAQRNNANADICRDLEANGVGIDIDTVRKYLDEASTLLTKSSGKS